MGGFSALFYLYKITAAGRFTPQLALFNTVRSFYPVIPSQLCWRRIAHPPNCHSPPHPVLMRYFTALRFVQYDTVTIKAKCLSF